MVAHRFRSRVLLFRSTLSYGRLATRLVNYPEMVDRAGAREIDPPRLVQPCHTDATRVLYQIPPVVPLAMMAMLEPWAAIATCLLVVPPGRLWASFGEYWNLVGRLREGLFPGLLSRKEYFRTKH